MGRSGARCRRTGQSRSRPAPGSSEIADKYAVRALARGLQWWPGIPIFVKWGEGAIIYALIIAVLLSGLLGATLPATAGPGDLNVTVGGITTTGKSQQSFGTGSDQGRRIDKPQTGDKLQTGLGSFVIPDTSRRPDGSFGGASLVPDTKGSLGGTTLPSNQGGTIPPGSSNVGQPSSQFCSSSDVTVGESTQSRFHCSNTVNSPIKP